MSLTSKQQSCIPLCPSLVRYCARENQKPSPAFQKQRPHRRGFAGLPRVLSASLASLIDHTNVHQTPESSFSRTVRLGLSRIRQVAAPHAGQSRVSGILEEGLDLSPVGAIPREHG